MGQVESVPRGGGDVEQAGILDWIISCGVHGSMRMPTPRPPSTPSTLHDKRSKDARRRLRRYKHDYVQVYLIVGEDKVAQDLKALQDLGVTHVANFAAGSVPSLYKEDGIEYLECSMEDHSPEQVGHWFLRVLSLVDAAKACGGRAYLHHDDSFNLPGAFAVAYMMYHDQLEMHDAMARVKGQRSDVSVNPGFLCQLIEHGKRMHESPPPPRMYLVGPHSSRDPQLVPRLCLRPPHRAGMAPSLDTLDPRGCFVIHQERSIVIWVGSKCEGARSKFAEAEATARRLQLYEGAPMLVHALVQPGAGEAVTAELPAWATADLESEGYKEFIAALSSPSNAAGDWLSLGRNPLLDEVFAIERGCGRADGEGQGDAPGARPGAKLSLSALGDGSVRTADAAAKGARGEEPPPERRGSSSSDEAQPAGGGNAAPKPELFQFRSGNWESMGVFDEDDLATDGMYLLHAVDEEPRKAFMWIGSQFAAANGGEKSAEEVGRFQATRTLDVPAAAVDVEAEGEETEEFWECFERGF